MLKGLYLVKGSTMATVASAALSDLRHVASMYKPLEVNALKLYLLCWPLPPTDSKVELFDLRPFSMVESFDLRLIRAGINRNIYSREPQPLIPQ